MGKQFPKLQRHERDVFLWTAHLLRRQALFVDYRQITWASSVTSLVLASFDRLMFA